MDTPLTHRDNKEETATQPSQAIGSHAVPEEIDAVEPAGDADRMMRMIVGSIYLDPQDIRRKLDDPSSCDSATPGKDLHIGLVILAVALVFLIFAFDLIFLRW